MNIYVKYILLILWMAMIFALSHEPATDSSARSGEIVAVVEPYMSFLPIEDISNFVRKSAHVVAYFILGALAFNVVRAYDMTRSKIICISILISLLYAISDEYHQTFIPGRSGEVSDVLLDTIAATIGVLCLHTLLQYRKRRNSIKRNV